LLRREEFSALAATASTAEADNDVRAEWRLAAADPSS